MKNLEYFYQAEGCSMTSSHHYSACQLNPYHLEGSILTHTMMVYNETLRLPRSEISNRLELCALFHDIGKPQAREIDLEKRRVKFFGHEGLSFWKSINYIKDLAHTKEDIESILNVISMHGNFIGVNSTKKEKEKLFNHFNDYSTFKLFLYQLYCDSRGRITKQPNNLSEEDIVKLLQEYQDFKIHNQKFYPQNFKRSVTLLVGLPCSGKSSYIESLGTNDIVISRDDYVMQHEKNVGLSFNDAFKNLTKEEHQEIDVVLFKDLQRIHKENKYNVIIDMTNMSKKSRRRKLNIFKNYHKRAVILATDYRVCLERNQQRTGKVLNEKILESMAKSFTIPGYDEFDYIEWIFTK